MQEAVFNVGRFCALADTLHKEYCRLVRKAQIPPQLIGNATMPVALESPTAGLARLSERVIVYQAWANSATGQQVGLAKWTLQELGKVANGLRGQRLPDRCDDVAKAQMLLGYLARPQQKSPHDTDPNTTLQKEGPTDAK